MSGEKYTGDVWDGSDISTPSFILSKEVTNVPATIENVSMTCESTDSIKPNGEYKLLVNPKVSITFRTSVTDFESDFYLDPLISESRDIPKNKSFSSLVSSCYVDWENLPEIIGSEVELCSPAGESDVRIQRPLDSHNYMILSDVNKENFYTSEIDDYLVDVLVDWATNLQYGKATISRIRVRENKVIINFELYTGKIFSSSLTIDSTDDNGTAHIFGGLKTDSKPYDFWDLCREAIGYIPTGPNYDIIMGSDVDVTYRNGRWKLKSRI